jgi:hypothetical protein
VYVDAYFEHGSICATPTASASGTTALAALHRERPSTVLVSSREVGPRPDCPEVAQKVGCVQLAKPFRRGGATVHGSESHCIIDSSPHTVLGSQKLDSP